MRRQLPVGPFDGLSPIRYREVCDSRTRIQQSIEILGGQEEMSSESMRGRRVFIHKQQRSVMTTRRRDLAEALQQLYLKRVRFGFQLVKQYFLFSESESSLHSNYRYLRETVQQGCSAMEDFMASQNQKFKVMAFEYIRVMASGKNYSTHYESNPSLEQHHRLTVLTHTIERVFQQLKERTLTDFYEQIRVYSERQRSKILLPVPIINAQDGAQTARRNTHSVASGRVSSYHPSEQFESKQFIYIVKTRSKMQSEQLSRKKSTFIKVPLVSSNVEINEISLVGENHQDRDSKKSERSRHRRNATSTKEMEQAVKHETCTNCRYCSTFRELSILLAQKPDFSKKKLSLARLTDIRSDRKR